MNERISELINQTARQYEAEVGSDTPKIYYSRAMEIFAELFVKEMSKTCEEHPSWTGRMIGEEIKQHFGVNE